MEERENGEEQEHSFGVMRILTNQIAPGRLKVHQECVQKTKGKASLLVSRELSDSD